LKFWDRKGEIKFLRAYLRSFPNSILFIYGPKSSGKSTLIMEVIRRLRSNERVIYFDFRSKLLRASQSFIDLFFKIGGSEREGLKSAFDIDEKSKKGMSHGEINPFEIMEEQLKRGSGGNVIIVDEVQKLKGLYSDPRFKDGGLMDELLNFFVRITKVEHISHVILMTSDTFFIEELSSRSLLANCAEYYLVDFFSDDIAKEILLSEHLNDVEASYVVSWCGGVPWFLERVLSKRKILGVKEAVKSLYDMVKGEVLKSLGRLWRGKEDLAKKDGEVLVKVVMGGRVDMLLRDRDSVERLASEEVVFYDPIKGLVRPQTRLHDRAIREILGLQ